jgi:dTDP-4-dehydrorhamnose reductase
MNIGLTGSNGLIGSNFIKNFQDIYKISTFKGDMTNFESVNHFMNQEFDVILHLASVIPKYDENGIPIKQSFSSNVIGTENIAKSASKFKTKVIFTSTQQVYGKSKFPLNENSELKSNNDYGNSKLQSEKKLQEFLTPEQYVILRISNVYGTFPERSSIIDSIAESIILDKTKKIGLNSQISRDYLHINDLLLAINLSFKKNGIFNICLGKSYSVNDLMIFFKDISGQIPKISFGNYLSNDIFLDNFKSQNELGFYPKYNIYEGIEKVFLDISKYFKKK